MSGRRIDDERDEAFGGGGTGWSAGIAVGAVLSGMGSGGGSASSAQTAEADSAAAADRVGTDSASRLNAGRTSPRGADRGGHVHCIDVSTTSTAPSPSPTQVRDRDVLSLADVRAADSRPRALADPEALDGPDDEAAAELSGPELVGRRVRLAREQAGLSVEEAAVATRIRATMIRQIEAGDFSRCGGDIYARGHVRALAKAAGVDAETLLDGETTLVIVAPPAVGPSVNAPVGAPTPKVKEAKVKEPKVKDAKAKQPQTRERKAKEKGRAKAEAEKAGEPKSAAAAARVVRPAKTGSAAAAGVVLETAPGSVDDVAQLDSDPGRRTKADAISARPKGANWTAAMLVVLLGLVVFGAMQLIGGDKSSPAAAAHVPPAAAKPAAPARPPAAAPAGVAVKIAADGLDSWLAVFSADGQKLYDNLLPAGSTQSFQDRAKLDVTFGNAAAIKMQLNGKDLGSMGSGGQVVHYTVNPTGAVAG